MGIHAGSGDYPPPHPPMDHISIVGNTMVAGPAAHKLYGIVVSGHLDEIVVSDVLVSNNVVDGYGITADKASAAIFLEFTYNVSMTGNVVTNFAEAGIQFYGDNTNFLCWSNVISNGTPSSAVAIRIDQHNPGRNVSGYIIANRLNGFALDLIDVDQPRFMVKVEDNHL
jgi:hypothetical protein